MGDRHPPELASPMPRAEGESGLQKKQEIIILPFDPLFNFICHMKHVLIFVLILSFVGNSGTVWAQTWRAKYIVNAAPNTVVNALPPGLSFNPTSGPVTQIQGNPTKSGTYRVVVYPVSGAQIGDMVQTQITINPKGTPSIPQFYGYLRNPLAFSSAFSGLFASYANFALAGTGGKILFQSPASNGGTLFYFTTDGENFSLVGKPDNIRYVDTCAAASGVFIIYDGNAEAFIKSTGGNFTVVDKNIYPSGFLPEDGEVQLVSDGTKIYFFQLKGNPPTLVIYDTNLFNSAPIQVWNGPVTGIEDMDVASAATDGTNTLFSVGDRNSGNTVLIRKIGATTSIPNVKVASVVFGNGFFLGSSWNGILKSTDGGASWAPISSLSDAGAMSYANGYFFSPRLGVSPDGENWLSFANFVEQDIYGIGFRIVSSGAGGSANLLFFGNRQLAKIKVPNFKGLSILPGYDRPYAGVVGTPFTGPKFELNP